MMRMLVKTGSLVGLVLALVACGGGSAGDDDDGVVRYRLVGIVTREGQTIPTEPNADGFLASGMLQLDETSGTGTLGHAVMTTAFESHSSVLGAGGPMRIEPDRLVVDDAIYGGDWPLANHGGTLIVEMPWGDTHTYEAVRPEPQASYATVGIIARNGAGGTPLPTLRATMVAVLDDGGHAVVPGTDLDIDDAWDGGNPLTLSISRSGPPEPSLAHRYGAATVAVELFVLYHDVDGNGRLDLGEQPCGATGDCVRGVSRVVLQHRSGTSPEWRASPQRFALEGWAPAMLLRTGAAYDQWVIAPVAPGTALPLVVQFDAIYELPVVTF